MEKRFWVTPFLQIYSLLLSPSGQKDEPNPRDLDHVTFYNDEKRGMIIQLFNNKTTRLF